MSRHLRQRERPGVRRCVRLLENGQRCGSTFDLKRVQLRSLWNRAKYEARVRLLCGHCRAEAMGTFRYAP